MFYDYFISQKKTNKILKTKQIYAKYYGFYFGWLRNECFHVGQ